jgi:murein DD-endopeptidase MepM/ murein hydrolase activator NlpD
VALYLALAAALLIVVGGFYAYRRHAQPPPRAKVARIPAAGLPLVVPLEAGLFERYARTRDPARATLTEVTVAPGSNLSKALEEVGLNSRNNYREVLDCLTESGTDPLSRLVQPGAVIKAFWADPEMESLARLEFYPVAGAAPWVVLPKSQGGFWRYSLASRPLNISGAGAGKVEGSLWNAGLRAGLDGGLIMARADVLASDIDFFTGLKKGDSFEVLYSRDYLDGRPQGAPIIEMVRMENNGRTFEYYRYINAKGQAGYYDRDGRSNLKTFFASPLQYTRISSGFSLARRHPIYKVVRPHQGVDYAAPSGTPVSAVAAGKVVTARWSGGFGRLVTIQHDAIYTTMYGHLSSFAPGLKEGSVVRQGDLIGRVGASGTATGPHPDFRLRKNGVFVNPIPELARQVGRQLEGADSKAFAGVIPVLQKRLAAQLAQAAARRPVAVDKLPLEPEVDFVEPDPTSSLDL